LLSSSFTEFDLPFCLVSTCCPHFLRNHFSSYVKHQRKYRTLNSFFGTGAATAAAATRRCVRFESGDVDVFAGVTAVASGWRRQPVTVDAAAPVARSGQCLRRRQLSAEPAARAQSGWDVADTVAQPGRHGGRWHRHQQVSSAFSIRSLGSFPVAPMLVLSYR